MMQLLYQVWLQMVQNFRRLLFEDLSQRCDFDLDLEDRKPMFFRMMMFQHTKFGCIQLSGSDDMFRTMFHSERLIGSEDIIIVPTNISWGFEPPLWPWPWGQQSQSHSWCCTTTPNLVAKGLEVPEMWIWARTMTLTLQLGTKPFRKTLRILMMHHHTKFACIQFSSSKAIFRPDKGVTGRHTDNLIPVHPNKPPRWPCG